MLDLSRLIFGMVIDLLRSRVALELEPIQKLVESDGSDVIPLRGAWFESIRSCGSMIIGDTLTGAAFVIQLIWLRRNGLCLRRWSRPPAKRGGRPRDVDVREVLNGIFYVLSTGCQWKALPKDLPPKSTAHYYFMLSQREQILAWVASPCFPGDARLRNDGGDPPSRRFAAAQKKSKRRTTAKTKA